MRRKMATYCFYIIMMLSSVSVFSLGSEPEPPQPKPNGPIGPGLPINGGITFLLITGAAYGVYALKKNKKS